MSQSLVVGDVALVARPTADGALLTLTWSEPVVLQHRHVRFWPLWRPWDPVFERSIPDQARGALTIDADPSALLSGKYRVEFTIVDPWVPPAPLRRPAKGEPGTAEVELIAPERQMAYLEARLAQQGTSFELLLERASVAVDTGDLASARSDWQWCFQHLDEGQIAQLVALIDQVDASGDQMLLRAMQLKMAAAQRVKRLLAKAGQGQVSPGHLRRYLSSLPRSELLPEATCELLLTVEDEPTRLHAAQQLIRRSNRLGVEAVLQWVRGAQMSDADAVALLTIEGQFSADVLEQYAEGPIALRLLEALARELGDRTPVVRPGTWIRTSAGWGRINRIENLAGDPAEHFSWKQDGYRLFVTLRPGYDAEPVVVDLAHERVTFPKASRIFTCTKCHSFSSRDRSLVTASYKGHDGVAHGGERAKSRPEKTTTRRLGKVAYSARKPKDELA